MLPQLLDDRIRRHHHQLLPQKINMLQVLYLASNNRHKLEELKAICKPFLPATRLLLARDLDPGIDWDETGATFEDNARIKAQTVRTAALSQGLWAAVLADDSGLAVDALGGAPGVHSARYAGHHGDDRANNERLLQELSDIPDGQRAARFVCVLHMIDERGYETTFRGECPGTILRTPRGDHGFGYDPLFLVDGTAATLAELPPTEKNAVSHRRRALDLWLRTL